MNAELFILAGAQIAGLALCFGSGGSSADLKIHDVFGSLEPEVNPLVLSMVELWG